MGFRKSFIVLGICAAITLPLTGCDSPQQKEASHIKRGNALFEKEQYEKARVEYKNAARIAPTDAEPAYRLGLVSEAEGDLRNAFGFFMVAEQQDNHFFPAVLKIAQYYMAAEQYDQAQQRVDAVLGLDPNNAEAHAVSAAILLRQKNFDAAEKEGQLALAKDPANVTACSAMTGLYSAKGDMDKAVETINTGIERNPGNIALLMLRVLLYQHADNLPKIDESYQAIFKLKPKETRFRVELAQIYVKAGKIDEAEATLRAGIAAEPDDWNLKHELVLFLGEHRSVDVAEAEIKALMKDNPKNDDLYFWLADLYASHDATDRAVALLEQIVARGQSDAPALNARTLLARIDIKRGNKDLAEKLITAVLTKEPDNRTALLTRASMSFDNGAYQSAVSDLRAIVRDHPRDQEALQLLGETLLVQGHLDLAIDTMKKLVDLDPTDMVARVRLAQMVQANGDTKQAIELITSVTKAAPDYPIGWESAARIAIDAQEWLPAEEAIRKLDAIEGQHLTAAFLEGQILQKNGKPEDAIVKYTEIVNADPATPLAERALSAMLDCYQKTGHMDAAASYLETLKSDTPYVDTMRGTCYAILSKTQESAAAFDKAIAAKPAFPEPYIDRAKLFMEAHQPEQAIDVLQKGTVAAPRDFRAPMMEAELLSAAGRSSEAIALYDDMLTRNPMLDAAANNLAELIADNEPNNATALEKARQAAERFAGSDNPYLLDTLAWVYFLQGNTPLADTIIERAAAHNDKWTPQIHYHYAAILMKTGKDDQAKAELAQALPAGANYPGIEEAKKMQAQLSNN